MRQFMTSTLEQRKDFSGLFHTHPMEAAWATEAIFFITVERVLGSTARLQAAVQISADGVNWVNEGTSFEDITDPGTSFQRVKHFGGWLRLQGQIIGENSIFNLTIHLVIKE